LKKKEKKKKKKKKKKKDCQDGRPPPGALVLGVGVGAPRPPPSCPPLPADTPQGLAACFAAFYPGSPAKAKFQQFVLNNTLCPRHVLNMPVEKCESMLQQHGFEGVVVFTFQSRLREAFAPPPTAYVPSPAPVEEQLPAPYVPPIVAAAAPPPSAAPGPAAALGQH